MEPGTFGFRAQVANKKIKLLATMIKWVKQSIHSIYASIIRKYPSEFFELTIFKNWITLFAELYFPNHVSSIYPESWTSDIFSFASRRIPFKKNFLVWSKCFSVFFYFTISISLPRSFLKFFRISFCFSKNQKKSHEFLLLFLKQNIL